MPTVDDGWNLIKLHGGDDPMASKSQLSIDVVSDDFNVDDDILSNTSSDDYADLSNPFNQTTYNKNDNEQTKFTSDSFDTLTGSITAHTNTMVKNNNKKKNKSKKNNKGHCNNKIAEYFYKILPSDLTWPSSSTLRLWHVVILSSLVSMLIFMGIQKYFEIFDGLAKNRLSATHASSKQELIYSDINFLNQDEKLLSTWKPSGKYYVDFDNHIAYPISQEDQIGWKKYKTDLVILWYTLRSKMSPILNSKSIQLSKAAIKRNYHDALLSINGDVKWLRDRLIRTKDFAVMNYQKFLPQLNVWWDQKWIGTTKACKNTLQKFQFGYKNYLVNFARLYHDTKSRTASLLNSQYISSMRATIKDRYRSILLSVQGEAKSVLARFKKTKDITIDNYNVLLLRLKNWSTCKWIKSDKFSKKTLYHFKKWCSNTKKFTQLKVKVPYQKWSGQTPKMGCVWGRMSKNLKLRDKTLQGKLKTLRDFTIKIFTK